MVHETIYESETTGNKIILPLSEDWGTIGICVSGGIDSAILTYITGLNIAKLGLNLRIKPISLNVANKPKYLPTARKVIAKLKSLLEKEGFNNWDTPYEGHVGIKECQEPLKLYAFRNQINALKWSGQIEFLFNGDTKNPSSEIRSSFHEEKEGARTEHRDEMNTVYFYHKTIRPFAFVDKRGTVEMYRKFNLVDELLPLTLSCDADRDLIDSGHPLPCGQCWWCDERSWALKENGLDPSL